MPITEHVQYDISSVAPSATSRQFIGCWNMCGAVYTCCADLYKVLEQSWNFLWGLLQLTPQISRKIYHVTSVSSLGFFVGPIKDKVPCSGLLITVK